MSSLNRVQLIGNLGKDPEIRTFDSGDKIASFSVATSEKWKDKNSGEAKEKTEWHNVTVHGPLVGVVEKYLSKGSKVYLEGKLQTRKWVDKEGADRWSTEVVLIGFNSGLIMLDGKDGSRSSGNDGGQQDRQRSSGQQADTRQQANNMDDEIPF